MTARGIQQVLGDLRATALDTRDQGDKFERLIAAFLRNDPVWAAKFEDVWLWPEWPGRGSTPDVGIDVVAKLRDADGFAAIQCKFYEANKTVSKRDIDSFLAASMRPDFGFRQRYIIDTAAGWSGNAEQELLGVAQRVDIEYLQNAAFDWDHFNWKTPEVLVPTGRKQPRPHQMNAMEDVFKGLQTYDRGKLIMACGTGKTFTSLKIAEHLAGVGKTVLFLVPSIQLLSQTLREWMANAEVDIRPFAVCSDVRVGRKGNTDDADMSTIDLTEPATTDAMTLVAQMRAGRHAKERMTVIFSTYQSVDVITKAQAMGLGELDLVICDEAHRTTGVTLSGGDDSAFVKVHDDKYVAAAKRLYMTATPRVFGEDVRRKAKESEAVLADMDDEALFGPELHRLGFGEAVEADLLTDYKVLVLAVDEQYVAENFQQAMAESGEIKLDDAAKLIGCWNGLSKYFRQDESADLDLTPMKTAVAFAKDIRSSQLAATSFPILVDRARSAVDQGEPQGEGMSRPARSVRVEARHVDGTMGIHERNGRLTWLKDEAPADVCRVLTNARCLSEGVDVPVLDAVLFLTPRGSQVDVVQSVGRVMRKAPGKELGYIVLPIVVPSGIAPEEALKDNERYKVVWQVLQALRSHDDRFHAMINQIELNKKRSDKMIIDNVTPGHETEHPAAGAPGDGSAQLALDFGFEGFRDAMYARIVQKVGERKYWDTWAKDVADIAQKHVTRIKGLLADKESNQAREFDVFLKGLRDSLNASITESDAIDMLSQHLITRPIFEALFDGYEFAETNPVARIMELMLASLDEHPLAAENAPLERFYDSVRRRVAGVDNAEGKQRILSDLYDKFFRIAFPRTVDKLGIVYTPVEIVDFILRSAEDVLRAEFGRGLTDEGVHILDPFAGTGTFMVRLLQSGLIQKHDLARKYATELHASEILLLAYYIATVNIETTYADLVGEPQEFPGLVLTDTFQSWEPDDHPDFEIFAENNERLQRLKGLPITVIVGNPPYSSGQDSANDNNANEKYPSLDEEIRKTYVERSASESVRSVYDSYIRAIKWATLRIRDRGVIAYVTNGGFLDSNSADGMRKTLADEFSSIYVYNLRGNARTSGEQRQKEGGTVFGGGSRATVAITLLVKDPTTPGPATIHYTDIGDYLTAEQKLAKVATGDTIRGLESISITPNVHGDWARQRRDDFVTFADVSSVFPLITNGVVTNRDTWVYAFNRNVLLNNLQAFEDAYAESLAGDRIDDATRISWSRGLEARLKRGGRLPAVSSARIRSAMYRPFTRRHLYYDAALNEVQYKTRQVFPEQAASNLGFVLPGTSSHSDFCVLMTDGVPDLHLIDTGTLIARWRYEQVDDSGMLDLGGEGELLDGYRKIDNITDEALQRFRLAYPDETITKDDIFFYVYGLLHSPEYRETYAADLKKMLPRIPFVRDFAGYAEAGRRLSELHLGYELVTPYPLDGLDVEAVGDPYDFFAVKDKKMQFAKVRVDGKLVPDRSTIKYNDRITVSGIPEEAYRYMLGSRSAIEWIIDRYWIKTDKASGIVNNPNDWSREVGDPRYILDLVARIVTVSVKTMEIVDSLPALEIIEGA